MGVMPNHAQATAVEQSTQARATMMRHGSFATLFLAGRVWSGLDPGQFDPLKSRPAQGM